MTALVVRLSLAIEAEARDAALDALEAAVLGITGIRAVQGVRFDGLMVNQAAVLEEIKKLRRQP